MRALITGISGFIGGHLCLSAPRQWDVWGTFCKTPLEGGYPRLLHLDIRNFDAVQSVLSEIHPDLLIHCAAHSRVSFCEQFPQTARETNTLATTQISDLCRNNRIRLLFLSSDMVFDGTKGEYSEQDAPSPINVYGRTKHDAERHLLQTNENAVVIRANLVYGKPALKGASFSEEVITTVNRGQPYYLYADQFRSFISVKNLVQCIWEIVSLDFRGVIHLGGSEPANRVTFAQKLAKQVGLDMRLLIPSSAEERVPKIIYPKRNTFSLNLVHRLLKTPLLDIDTGLALEYPGK